MLAAIAVAAAACGGTSQGSPTGSGTPGGSTVAGGSAASSGSPRTPSAELARQGFIRFAASATATYHVAFSGTVRATVSDLTVSGTIDVAGLDTATSTRFVFANGTRDTVETRWVNRLGYARANGATWRQVSFDPDEIIDPLGGTDQGGAITSIEAKKVAGKPGYVVTASGGRLLDLTTIPVGNLTDEAVSYATWTLALDAAGHPVSGSWKLTGSGRVGGQLQEIVVDLKVTFSKIGSKVSVKAP